jgi:hypothetical protein
MTANGPLLDVLARETNYLKGSPTGWRRALQALPHEEKGGRGGIDYSALVSWHCAIIR